MRRTARIALGAFVAAGATGLTAGAAQAAPAQSATADVTSGAFALKFTAQRAAGAPATAATGTFEAVTSAGPATLMKVAGPVTCLDVRGQTLGLFYPVTSSTPSAIADAGTGVFIYLVADGAGRAKMVGFVPVPYATTTSCAPGSALMPAMGSATLMDNVPAPAPAPAPAAPKRFAAKPSASFSAGKRTRVRRLRLSGLPAGSSVRVTCRTKARGCPFSSRTRTPSGGAVSLQGLFGTARLRPGAVVRIALSAPGFASRTVTYTVRRGRAPARKIVG